MPEYKWPEMNDRDVIGKRTSRIDGPVKVTGAAKYAYDVKRPGMLFTKVLRCPHAHAKITALDTSAVATMPGVKAVRVIQNVGTEIQWALDEIVAIAATSEQAAEDAVRAIKVQYEVLPHFLTAELVDKSPDAKPAQEQVVGDPNAKSTAEVTSRGYYGMALVAHCCMEAHGQVCEWTDDQNLTAWCSTQAVSSLPQQFSEGLGIPASNVHTITQHMGGGFGSKFNVDRWGVECAQLAKEAKAPVKWMLERDAELTVAGDRPSAYAEIEVGAKKDGTVVYWASKSWGSGGPQGTGTTPLPYVFGIPNRRHQHISVPTHVAASRAWRAPNHPQACFLTMAALDDLAAALQMDPLVFFAKNLALTQRAPVYEQQMQMAAELAEWKTKWHPRGDSGNGPIKRGLGISFHTWGGLGHQSNCELSIFPDGSVEAKLASQDLGTGTRTVIGIVIAETLGIPLENVKVSIGDSTYPASGGSGGSTTVGGVSASSRRAALLALEQLFAKVAPELGVPPEQLEAENGTIRVKGDTSKSMPWKQAASRVGMNPLTVRGANPGPGKLIDQGVGGVQIAEVAVDVETGIVKLEKMVAIQDCGLIINLKTAESQVYGGLIMGISYALTEEKIHDPVSGRMLNADMEFYKLAGLPEIGELVVRMVVSPEHDKRGVIGLGEPPVISPGAAISNAVANAIGVRVPYLPLTPDRVLSALEKGGTS